MIISKEIKQLIQYCYVISNILTQLHSIVSEQWSDIPREIEKIPVRQLGTTIHSIYIRGNDFLCNIATIAEYICQARDNKTRSHTTFHEKLNDTLEAAETNSVQFRKGCKEIIRQCSDACYQCDIAVGNNDSRIATTVAGMVGCSVMAGFGAALLPGPFGIITSLAAGVGVVTCSHLMEKESSEMFRKLQLTFKQISSSVIYIDEICFTKHEVQGLISKALQGKCSHAEYDDCSTLLEVVLPITKAAEGQRKRLCKYLLANSGAIPEHPLNPSCLSFTPSKHEQSEV